MSEERCGTLGAQHLAVTVETLWKSICHQEDGVSGTESDRAHLEGFPCRSFENHYLGSLKKQLKSVRSKNILMPLLVVLLWAGCRLLRFPDCPGGMAEIENYCIDRWEAHLVDQSPFDVPESGRAATTPDVIPQGYISADVADAACRKAGKRLCTSDEWLRACRGPDETIYPYGNTYNENACNEGREEHPILELFGENADFSAAQMNDPRVNQLPNSLDPTGANPECVTPEGVYDMHGNLHEWVSDSDGTFRGGFYVDAEINGRGCLYRTTAHTRAYHDYSTGFRCCADL